MQTKHRLVGAVISLATIASLVAPTVALANSGADQNYSSYSIEQLQNLIAKLQKQLEEMKKGTQCFVSDQALSFGDGEPGDGMDNNVRRLQMFLKEKTGAKLSATGYFGKLTKAALQSFQKANGLSASGDFDDATRAKAHSMYCKNVLRIDNKEKQENKDKQEQKKPETASVVRSISLSVTDGKAFWKVDGYSSKGFKVVYSKNPSPTYPTRDGDKYIYLDNPNSADTRLEAFNGSGTYYVRVCEYLGGACGVYSNEVSTNL